MKGSLISSEIGKLVSPIKTWNPPQSSQTEPFLYIDLSSVDQKEKRIVATSRILPKDAPSRARQLVLEGDVLVSTVRPNLNGVAYVPRELDGATASTGFCVLRPKHEKLVGRYLYHWVQFPNFVEEMVKLATGASYPAVSDRIIKDSKIPLPPLAEQKRIAAILDKADAIRRKRQAAIKLADDFLRATFLDMFGDPISNPKGWETLPIKKAGKVSTGTTPSSGQDGMFGGNIPFVTPGDLERDDEEIKRFVTRDGSKNSRTVRKGATFVCCIGATIGKVGISKSYSAFNQQINAVEWSNRITDNYGYWAMKFLKKLVIKQAISTTLPILKKSEFEKIEIPIPPKELQNKFSFFIEKAESLFMHKKEARLESVQLLESLSQRAFSGDL